jgi:hypothetical protein
MSHGVDVRGLPREAVAFFEGRAPLIPVPDEEYALAAENAR